MLTFYKIDKHFSKEIVPFLHSHLHAMKSPSYSISSPPLDIVSLLNLLHQEVPYGIAVLIESYEYIPERNIFNISASLNVEKESQKKIIIGVNGSMIKEIGTKARQELLKIYDSKIFLKLYVKVAKN